MINNLTNLIKYLFKFFCEKDGKPSSKRIIAIIGSFVYYPTTIFFLNKLINKGYASSAVDLHNNFSWFVGVACGIIVLDKVKLPSIFLRKKK